MKNDVFRNRMVENAIGKGYSDLLDIATYCGIYPQELKDILDGLIRQNVVIQENGFYFLASDEKKDRVVLPPAHPLDYDWRFDKNTVKMIADELLKECPKNSSILLLGTHSIQVELLRREVGNTVILIDNNKLLVDELNNYSHKANFINLHKNLFDNNDLGTDYGLDIGNIGVVFMDPPWYLDAYLVFLDFAAKIVDLGGLVFTSLIPVGMRETAYKERDQFFVDASKLGLHIEQLLKNTLTYITPIFERKSLQSQSLFCVGNWRKGDFVMMRKVAICKNENHSLTIPVQTSINDDSWLDFVVNGYPIRIKNDLNDKRNPEIISIEPQDILPTVSCRYPGRKKVVLWLWDNRVYGIKGTFYFIAALCKLSEKQLPVQDVTIDDQCIEVAISLICNIINE